MSTGCGALDKTEKTGATSAFRSTQKKKSVGGQHSKTLRISLEGKDAVV